MHPQQTAGSDGREVERKWLVPEAPPEALQQPGEELQQGYLLIAEDGGEVRLRRGRQRAWLTVKAGHGLVRREHETELTEAQADALWPATEGQRLEKTRHRIPLPEAGELVIELDVYGASLTGLVVAEVEFSDAEAAAEFRAPAWFGREVTGEPGFSNQSLARSGRPQG